MIGINQQKSTSSGGNVKGFCNVGDKLQKVV